MFRLFVLIFALLAVALHAEPQVVLSSISSVEMQSHLNELQKMKSQKLDERSKQMLNELWQEASEIAELNDHCQNISLNKVLDDRCENFYKVTLPEFENKFFLVTGEIRLNSWELQKGVSAKAQMIESCYDAFPLQNLEPSNFYVPEGGVNPEPLLGNNVEVMYDMELAVSKYRIDGATKQLKSWFNSCEKYILRTGSNEFAPMFLQLLKTDRLESENLHLVQISEYRFGVVLAKGINATYSLNGKELMNFSMPANTEILSISSEGNVRLSGLRDRSFNGKIVLTPEEYSRGLMGRITWNSISGYNNKDDFFVNENVGSKPVERSSPAGTHVAFQFRTGVGLGMGGVVNENLRREYPDVWTNDKEKNEIVDSALIHGYWPWIGLLRVYSGRLGFGIGGGGALVWASTCDVEGSINYQAGDDVNLQIYVNPVGQVEIGYRSKIDDGKDYDLEFGMRETVLVDNHWFTALTGAYIKVFDLFDFELGWHYAANFSSSVYAAFNLSIFPHVD